MKCPFCEKDGQRSTVTPDSWSTSTCIAFSPGHYDEDGQWVRHADPNTRRQGYSCSRGHGYTIESCDGQPDEIRLNYSPPADDSSTKSVLPGSPQ